MRSRSRFPALAWLACVLAIVSALAWKLGHGVRFETNILAMLPADERDPALHEIATRLQGRSSRTLMLLVRHEDAEAVESAALWLESHLRESTDFESVFRPNTDDGQRQFHDLYFPYRWQMLSPAMRDRLEHGAGAKELVERVVQILQSPLSSAATATLERDPLLLHLDLVRSFADLGIVRSGADESARAYAALVAVIRADPFDAEGSTAALERIESSVRELHSRFAGMELAYTGVPRFAARTRDTMRSETSWIGLASTLGTAACIWLVLRGWRPLALTFLPILTGLCAGTLACFLVFDEPHVLTLALGTTLTGMGVDYALHYLAVQRAAGPDWNPDDGLRAILPGITIGMLTSVVAFLGLCLTPFPVLRQFAVFSSIGLIAAWLTVVAWLPALSTRPLRPLKPNWIDQACAGFIAGWARVSAKRGTFAALLLCSLATTFACLRLNFEDDVRALQELPPDLAREDERLRAIVGNADSSRFVLVEGESDEAVLSRLERCEAELDACITAGALEGKIGLSAFLPSRDRQRADHALLARQLGPDFGALATALESLGFDAPAIEYVRSALSEAPHDWLDVPTFLAHPASQALRTLWLGDTARGRATTVMLRGVLEAGTIESRLGAISGVHYVDRVRDMSRLMARHRVETSKLVAFAYLAVFAVLAWRMGPGRAVRVMIPAILAASSTLLILDAAGARLSLFHALGLVLVLGLAVDYGAFLAETPAHASTTMLALALSAATTITAFGWMSMSSAPPVRALGTSVAIGIALALFLAPSAWPGRAVVDR